MLTAEVTDRFSGLMIISTAPLGISRLGRSDHGVPIVYAVLHVDVHIPASLVL